MILRSDDDRFLQGVYENQQEKYTVLWECLDGAIPEPLWKRKKMGVNVGMSSFNER